MSQLLYLESSPRKDRSASTEVAQSFITAFQNADAKNKVETIDLWNFQLPEFDGDHINAKYRVLQGENPTNEETKAWDEISNIVATLKMQTVIYLAFRCGISLYHTS